MVTAVREKEKEKKRRKNEKEREKRENFFFKLLTSSSDPEFTPLMDFRKGGACSVAMARAKSAATTR